VCEAAAERQDLCAAAGRWQIDPDTCEATVESCRAQDPGPQVDCSLARFDFGSDCTATVDQYLTCIEDWNHALDCAEASYSSQADVREACIPLLEACPHFVSEYGDPASFVPRCDAESSPERVDNDDDVRGLDACRPLPARMVALGDSIAACTASYDPDGSFACAADLIAEYLQQSVAPYLVYESFAVPGARTMHAIEQAQGVAPGPGHLFVWVYLGGNDIAPCRVESDEETIACVEREIEELLVEWEPILAYFSDPALFPDGATFLLNTQYALLDECENPGGYASGMSPAIAQVLQAYNQRMFIDRALERADTVAIDQYPDWLGRGGNADNARCPHCYRGDNSSWLSDGVHPSATGQHHIADKWKVAIDAIYAACPAP
jgi:lysophospholipase L1-like esterase